MPLPPPPKAVRVGKLIFRTFKKYKFGFLGIIVLGFLTGLSGALGIGALIPLFSLLIGEQGLKTDLITRIVDSIFSYLNLPLTLPFLIGMISILFVVKAITQFSARFLNRKIAADFENDTRTALFTKTLKSSWPYLLEHKIGHLEKTLMKEINVVSGLINQISALILISTSLVIYLAAAFAISTPITLITLIFGLILFLILYPILDKIKDLTRKVRDTERFITHFINENMLGAKMVKTAAAEDRISEIGKRYFKKHKETQLKAAFHQTWVASSFEPISFLFIAVLLLIYYRNPVFDLASFAAIIYLIQKIFTFFQSGQGIFQDIAAQIPYIQSVTRYRKETRLNQELRTGKEFEFKNKIEFCGVSFAYRSGKEVLTGVNFTLNKGEILGLIGPSGAGKTTIVDLLTRLFAPSGGEITADGQNISETNLVNWRKNIGYMPQDPFLLNDTIENNIKFYDEITKKDIVRAAKMANIYDFILSLPQKFDTVLGERGVKISAGQRQRIMLARTLARNPQILILDEATSALDNQSEAMIQKTINDLKGKITILVIAHRLSTIMNSDRLIVLDDGKIIEEGRPQELLKDKDSHFYKIYNILNGS